jgi:hypothetical protein
MPIFLAGHEHLCDSRSRMTPDSRLGVVFPGPVALRRARANPLRCGTRGWGEAAAASLQKDPARSLDARFLEPEAQVRVETHKSFVGMVGQQAWTKQVINQMSQLLNASARAQ